MYKRHVYNGKLPSLAMCKKYFSHLICIFELDLSYIGFMHMYLPLLLFSDNAIRCKYNMPIARLSPLQTA